MANDGCSATCTVEEGFTCSGAECMAECGDGQVRGEETCDDANTEPEDGCDAACNMEAGWACGDEPSDCSLTCGNGVLDASEACDAADIVANDGCSPSCQVDSGYVCTGSPSVCAQTCGNSELDTGEGCDDGNLVANDGCSSSCAIEAGWNCGVDGAVCGPVCGDGQLDGGETCDDGGTANSDGCSSTCSIENEWSCAGQPSMCVAICGNGELDAGEDCDDGNSVDGDGCAACEVQQGWECGSEPSACEEVLAPVIVAFTTSVNSVPGGGGEVLLAWSVNGADQLRIDADGMNDLGVVTGNLLELNVTADVTLTLVAENAGGSSQQSVSVQVNSIGEVAWTKQFGTAGSDSAADVAVAADGSIYVVGSTDGDFGEDNAGLSDAFLAKFDPDGTDPVWVELLGSTHSESALTVSLDADGNIYMVGSTSGALQTGSTNNGTNNCYYAKYNSGGAFQWVYQYVASNCRGAVGGDALYIANIGASGYTLTKFTLAGAFSWTRTVDFSQSEKLADLVADAAGAYGVGNNQGGMGGGPAVAFGFSSAGDLLFDTEWSGTADINVTGAALANSTLYMSVNAFGGQSIYATTGGLTDAAVAFFDTSTGVRSSSGLQFGTAGNDGTYAAAVDARGSLLVVGGTDGSLVQGQSGRYFVAKRGSTSAAPWTAQFGPSENDGGLRGVAACPNGMVAVVGSTQAELDANPPGGNDGFLMVFK
jgi:cysteine-rich repeat protein